MTERMTEITRAHGREDGTARSREIGRTEETAGEATRAGVAVQTVVTVPLRVPPQHDVDRLRVRIPVTIITRLHR